MQKKYILFLMPFILYIGLLPLMPQMEPDEARYSLISSAMNQSGNYVTPHIKNVIYLEKPPLVSWATAISFKVFGENDFSARLFVALCAWGCILLAYFMGRHFRDEKTGLYAAMLLTISAFPFILGRINILDSPLTFFVCLSIWLGYLALQKQKKSLFYLFYFACALGFLTKGIIGVVFPFGILVVWLVWVGKWRQIRDLFSPIGILIFLVVVCPWLFMAQKENPDFLWFFFVREHFLRFTTKMHGKTEPFYFYLPILIGGLTPWLFYLIKAWKNKYIKESLFREDENKLLIVWFLVIFVFYQISSSKLAPYVAPLFIPLALFTACIFKKYEEEIPAEQSGAPPAGAGGSFSKRDIPRLAESIQTPAGAGGCLQRGKSRKIIYRVAIISQSLIIFIALLLPPILNKYSDAEKGLVVMVSDKWWIYITMPLISLVLMTFLPDLIQRKFKKGWFLTLYFICAMLLGSILLPLNNFLSPYRSAKVTKEAIALHVPADRDLYQYKVNFYGIDFYNKIRTPIVEDFGELSDGMVKMPQIERKRYFILVDEFFKLCEEEKNVYCITQHNKKLKQITQRFPKTEILWDNKAFYLLHIKN